jgi:5S rRNA maturation endonuclease (ribonuclease M5)
METIEEFIKELVEESYCKPVVVEGKKDKITLEKFGVHNIHTLSQKPLFSFVEKIAKNNKSVILLLDNDKEGKKLFKKLLQEFSRMGLQIDVKFERAMRKFRISHVEGIRGCNHGKSCSCFSKVHHTRHYRSDRCRGQA